MKWFYYIILTVLIFTLAGYFFVANEQFLVIKNNEFLSQVQNLITQFRIKKNQPPVTMLFVGDIMLSRGVGRKMASSSDYTFPFGYIHDFLNSADLTIGNLEGPVSDKGQDMKSKYSFRADPRVLDGIKLSGFDILDVNNNHSMDWGIEAFKDTLVRLENAEINYSGGGMNSDEANEPIIKSIGNTKIAFLSYRDFPSDHVVAQKNWPGLSNFDQPVVLEKIKNIKQNNLADLVVVLFHWGEEYQTRSNARQQKIAYDFIDGGTDLIVGHHPHVVQEIEKYKDGWVAYSLGNFIFDQYFSAQTMEGLILKVFIENKKITKLEPLRSKITPDFRPYLASFSYPQ